VLSLKLPWLDDDSAFPPAHLALREPAGLLAAGADLSITRLYAAYTQGIFPWFQQEQPILWWSPNPRMVLKCSEFHPSHSLRKRLRQIATQQQSNLFEVIVKVDTALPKVLHNCAMRAIDAETADTWITPEMQDAYIAWHEAGHVHSIETWMQGELVGGLYGVSLGHMFYGESMFSFATDASKIALAHLVLFLQRQGVEWIDCQMQTGHLERLGARPVAREAFIEHVRSTSKMPDIHWQTGWIDHLGVLHA
jgi:leucyl/phenylalanyl-tRNA--protein transferase